MHLTHSMVLPAGSLGPLMVCSNRKQIKFFMWVDCIQSQWKDGSRRNSRLALGEITYKCEICVIWVIRIANSERFARRRAL